MTEVFFSALEQRIIADLHNKNRVIEVEDNSSPFFSDLRCGYYTIAINQRLNELLSGKGLEGTKGYEETGCYACTSFRKDCEKYYSKKSLREKKYEA